jgi:small subunit ribosomal protein S1
MESAFAMADPTIPEFLNSPEPVSDFLPEAAPESTSEPAPEPAAGAAAEPSREAPVAPGAEAAPQPASGAAPEPAAEQPSAAPVEPEESFADALTAYERSHARQSESRQLNGRVISLSADQVFLDVGYKIEGVLPRSAFENNAEGVEPGDVFPVSITGRNEEGYYELSRFRVAQPRDWSALEAAFAGKLAVAGTVTAVVKGGLSVDIGVRAFMPASRSGAHDAADLEALVGQQIHCRLIKLDTADEDVVVDRRVVLEEEARGLVAERRAALKEGDTVSGSVRTLMPYGAFVDLDGVDGLLHVSDISRTRIAKVEDALSVGQQLRVRILKIDAETGKISLGLKQLEPEPWETAPSRYQQGQRISGTVTRLADFGAFVEIEPGIEGLIHISEMSWAKKVRHPGDLLKQGERVDAVILSIRPPSGSEPGRIALGLKQTLVDPWTELSRNFPVGSQIEGPVTKVMNFGAFVEVAEGVEGLVHISEIVADRRLNHPSDVLRAGQRVKAQVLAIDPAKRQMKLSMKQLIPTSVDEYIAEHKTGDRVSGRVVNISSSGATVELGEGTRAVCRQGSSPASGSPASGSKATPETKQAAKADLSAISLLLKARWKGQAPAVDAKPEPLAEAQIRDFRIVKLDADAKRIEVELA